MKTDIHSHLGSFIKTFDNFSQYTFAMHVEISILILIFSLQILYSIAEWDPYSPLIQTQFAPQSKIFPRIVRQAHNGKIVYHNKDSNTPPVTFAMCPEPRYDPKSAARQIYCNYGKSFPASNYAWRDLRTRCSEPVEPFMMADEYAVSKKVLQPRECGNGGHIYRFAYWRCEKKTRNWLAVIFLNRARHYEKLDFEYVYKACFHETNKLIQYGSFTIATPHLLANKWLIDEQAYQFDFQTKAIYPSLFDQFEKIAEPLFQKNSQYRRRMVLPPELLPFALQRKPLFHYMNVAPMDKRLIHAWESLMLQLKKKISQMNQVINITAGLLNEIRDENDRIKYLGYRKPNNPEARQNETQLVPEIAIPHTWWIQIYDRSRKHGVVILMINEPYHNNMELLEDRRCHQDTCEEVNLSAALFRVVTAYPYAVIYCCYPSFINEKFHFNGQNKVLTFPSENEVEEQLDEVEAVTSEEGEEVSEEQEKGKKERDDDYI